MKKSTRLLIILLAALVAVGGVAVALTLINNAKENAEAGDTDSVTVLSIDSASVNSIEYEYAGETVSFSRENGSFVYTKAADYPIDSTYIDSILDTLASVTSDRVIELPSELSEYGLGDGALTAVIGTADGSYTLSIGDTNAQTSTVYLRVNGGSKVYMVPANVKTVFEHPLSDYLAADAPEEIDSSSVKQLAVTSADGGYEIEYVADNTGLSYSHSYNYFYDGPEGVLALENASAQELIDSACALAPLECVSFAPTDAEKSAHGFDSPERIEMLYDVTSEDEDGEEKTESKRFYIELGDTFTEAEDNGGEPLTTEYRYMMFKGSDMIFIVEVSSLTDVLTPDVASLCPEYAAEISFDTLTGLDITFGGSTTSITVGERGEDGARQCAIDGKAVNYVYVESFVLDLSTLPTEGSTFEEPSGAPYMTLHYTRSTDDDFSDMTLTLYNYDSSFYLAELTGRNDRMLISVRDAASISDKLAELASYAK